MLCPISNDDGEASIYIRDRGPGLSDQIMEQACQVFAQIGREKFEQQGCGIGLTIASYFVKLNEGTLSFSHPEDRVGLEVKITFAV